MKIFVTGGTGFVGHYVCKELLEKGHELVILARNPNKIPSLATSAGVTMVQGALLDYEIVAQAVRGCEAVVHLALGWGETPLSMLQNDTAPTVHLLQAASEAGVQHFIYTSSTAALGRMRQPMHEDLRRDPMDLYGATKAASESYVVGYPTTMKRNVIRPGYIFGNPAWPDGLTQPDGRFRQIAAAVQNGEVLKLVRHDGTQFLHGSQIAQVFSAVLQASVEDGMTGEVFLGLSRRWVSWESLAKRAVELLRLQGKEPHPDFKVQFEELGWGADPYLYSVEKIRERFGLEFDAVTHLDGHLNWCLAQTTHKP